MEHFTAICCYGGEPFIDFHLNGTFERTDPTDWSAELIKDFNSNSSDFANTISNEGIDLSNCEMFNITFTNLADQFLYDLYRAEFECRCPIDRTGPSCEYSAPISLPHSTSASLSPHLPYTMILVLSAVLLAFVAILMMMVRGCFCDCFGPFSREDPYDKPLDPEDVRKCLQKVRENQARREMANEPLVSRVVPPPPLVSESYSAPYVHIPPPMNQYPSAPPTNPSYRAPSPPPAYCDIDRVPPSSVNFSSTQI